MNPSLEPRASSAPATLKCVLAGGLLALAYPPLPLGFLVWGTLAFALQAIGFGGQGAPPSWRTILWRGWIFGAVLHGGTLYWTAWVSAPGMATMVVILGLYVALVFVMTGALMRRFGHRALWLFPLIWTAHEYLRGVGTLAFPWTNLSLTQVKYPMLIQYADVTGDLGMSFLIVLVNVFILDAAGRLAAPRHRPVGVHVTVIVLAFILPYLYGRGAVTRLADDTAVRVAVLQGDIDSFRKWDEDFVDRSLAVYETQTRAAAARGAELIVWPETAIPMYLRAEPQYRRVLQSLSAELSVSLLVGTLEYDRLPEEHYVRYNAAVALDDGTYQQDYHAKLQLVPLGEMIPFADRFRFLDRLDVGGAHFTAGERRVLFEHPKGPYAAVICYESAFPDIMRRFAAAGARFFVNITNDGWYGFSSGPGQHAALATFRAIETRRPIARSANTGISGFFDRAGRFHEQTLQYVPDVRLFDLPLGSANQKTFFVRNGMYVGKICVLATIVALLSGVVVDLTRRWRTDNGADPPVHGRA